MVFRCEFCKIFKNIFFYRTRPVAASTSNHLLSFVYLYHSGYVADCFKYSNAINMFSWHSNSNILLMTITSKKKFFFWFELLIVRWIWIILSVVLWNNFVQKFNDFIGDHSFSTFAKFSEKLNISYPLIPARTCAYQGVRNVSFSGNFANILNEWSICIFQLFLNIFLAMFPFYKPWAAENLVFLVFSGGVKW